MMNYKISIWILFIVVFLVLSMVSGGKIVTDVKNGTLKGFINNSMGRPIVNAYVSVSFHDEYRSGFSNNMGYYEISDIPVCKCLKNVSVEKIGYKDAFADVSMDYFTWQNFTMELDIMGVVKIVE